MLTLRNRIVSNDPELVYENKPNFKYYDGKEWVNLTNSLGLMDREYPLNKSNNTFRILALGDSVTEGYLLPSPEAAYSKQLEKMLNNNLNSGFSKNLEQSFEKYRNSPEYKREVEQRMKTLEVF